MNPQLGRRPFTTAEYHRLIEIGVLTKDDRVELLDGAIIQLASISPRRAAGGNRLAELLGSKTRASAIVSVRHPLQLGEYSELQPALALLKRRPDYYAQNHPVPADVLLVIEVADESVADEFEVKLPLYARAGVSEVWLLDLCSDRIEVRSQPASGVYQEARIILRGQKVVSQALSQLKLKADDILG